MWSNTTAARYPSEPDAIRAQLAAQVAEPVRFAEQIEAMYAAGARCFVEAGPGQVLTRLVDGILGDRPHVAVACDASEAGLRQLLRAVAALAAAGVAIDPSALFAGRDAAVIELVVRSQRPGSVWLVSGAAVRPAGTELAPAKPIAPQGYAAAGAPVVASDPNGRDTAVLEFLRGMRSMVMRVIGESRRSRLRAIPSSRRLR